MYTFIIVLIVLVTGAVTYLLCSSIGAVGNRSIAEKVLQYGKESEYYIYDICSAVQAQETVFGSLHLPAESETGTYYITLDVVAVNRGGIAVIKVNNNRGQIINPRVGNWIQRNKNKFLKFRNPFQTNDSNISVLAADLKKAGFGKKVPIKNIVVFTNDDVKFNEQYSSLLKPGDVAPFLRNMGEYKNITKQDAAEICSILEKYRRSYNRKMRSKRH